MRKIKNSNWQNCYHKDYCIDWWARWILWYAALIIAAVLNTINRLQLKIIEQLQSETKLFYTKTSIAEINFSAINLYRRFQFYKATLYITHSRYCAFESSIFKFISTWKHVFWNYKLIQLLKAQVQEKPIKI